MSEEENLGTSAEELEGGIFNLVVSLIQLYRENGESVEKACNLVEDVLSRVSTSVGLALQDHLKKEES